MDPAGSFVVAWQDGSGIDFYGSYGIYFQRYDAQGVPQGTATLAVGGPPFPPGRQIAPSVAMDSAGDFTVSFSSTQNGATVYGIYAQRYSSTGAAQGTLFTILGGGLRPPDPIASVAMDAGGDMVVAWQQPD